MKKVHWNESKRPLPKHPYRDSVIAYGVMAGILVAIVVATGGSLVRGVIAAVAVFVASTAFSWWRWHERLRSKTDGKP